jgi:hypothetical protein
LEQPKTPAGRAKTNRVAFGPFLASCSGWLTSHPNVIPTSTTREAYCHSALTHAFYEGLNLAGQGLRRVTGKLLGKTMVEAAGVELNGRVDSKQVIEN